MHHSLREGTQKYFEKYAVYVGEQIGISVSLISLLPLNVFTAAHSPHASRPLKKGGYRGLDWTVLVWLGLISLKKKYYSTMEKCIESAWNRS